MVNYSPKYVTTKIQFSSRVSMNISDAWYTFEASEERSFPTGVSDVDIEAERKALWDTLNAEVDKQAVEVYDMIKMSKSAEFDKLGGMQ